jgi:hypothetical protein
MGWGWRVIYVGASPYARLYDPVGVGGGGDSIPPHPSPLKGANIVIGSKSNINYDFLAQFEPIIEK